MTGKEIKKEVDNYLIKTREERKNAGLAKVPEFDERDIKQAYRDGMQSGLWRHSYDYLVKTADLKKRYEMQKEINKELVDENEELKKLKRECETSLCRAEYQYNYEQLTKAKEIIREFVEWATWQGSNCPSFKSIQDKAEQFLKGEIITEQSNECHDCAKFDEMPNGPRCKTCDNGSHFQKKEEA